MVDLPDLSGLSLDSQTPTGAGEGTYDPTRGGSDVQAYFADMVLDSDRNAMYAHAIIAAVRDFVRIEGRAPVVLDVGCGFGILTLFALVAGAEHVLSVDVNQEHVQRLPERLPNRFVGKYTAKHIDIKKPNPFAAAAPDPGLRFDMLISEILGTFANGEGESVYLPAYATHMTKHASGAVYCVPHRVTQTFRKVALPRFVNNLIDTEFALKYMPTNHVGLLYEYMAPPYLAGAIAVRIDRFDVLPFRVELPQQILLGEGSYAAEWVAELWPGIKLRNTWGWAHNHTADAHSKHARARAWGLMLFSVPTDCTAVVNSKDVHDPRVMHSTIPDLLLEDTGSVYALDPKRRSSDRLRNTYTFAYSAIPVDDGADRYISMKAIGAGMPWPVTIADLYGVTLGALVRIYHEKGLYGQWLSTLAYMGVLPFLAFDGDYRVATDYDVPVKLRPPAGPVDRLYNYLTDGALFWLGGDNK